MWERKKIIWSRWHKNILAPNALAARFLTAFLAYAQQRKLHLNAMEVIDLQRYKRIQKPTRVGQYLREKKGEAFIFFIYKN